MSETATTDARSDRAMSLTITARTMRDMLEAWLSARWNQQVMVTDFNLASDFLDADPVCQIHFQERPAELPKAVEEDLNGQIREAFSGAGMFRVPNGVETEIRVETYPVRVGTEPGRGGGGGYYVAIPDPRVPPAVPRDDPDMPDRIAQGA